MDAVPRMRITSKRRKPTLLCIIVIDFIHNIFNGIDLLMRDCGR